MTTKRPKATDTEDDLLELQKQFLTSGERPSASLKVFSGERTGVEQSRDVVSLKKEGVSGVMGAMMLFHCKR